jgi:hypothetical protein
MPRCHSRVLRHVSFRCCFCMYGERRDVQGSTVHTVYFCAWSERWVGGEGSRRVRVCAIYVVIFLLEISMAPG